MEFSIKNDYYFSNYGYCSCCATPVQFLAKDNWLRDSYICRSCGSIPRERALMYWMQTFFPDWKNLSIHESSPIFKGASLRLKEECANYVPSFYFHDKQDQKEVDGFLNIDIENQFFPDNNFDLIVTQDVFEHLYNPSQAFKEVFRTLRKGGAHIFTVPLVNKSKKTQQWSQKNEDGTISFFYEKEYHGNPVDESGSPVAWHWGFDICEYIQQHTGMVSTILLKEDINQGILGEYLEVIISFKL
jgi:SAM-dependent methyltransferase